MSDEGRVGVTPGSGGVPSARPLAVDVFDTMPVATGLLATDGSIVHANVVLADLLGTEPEELVGRNVLDLVDPPDRAPLAEQVELLVSGRRNAVECLLRATPSALHDLSWSVRANLTSAYGPGGVIAGLVLLVFDLGPVDAPPSLPAGLAEVLEEGSDFLITAGPDGRVTYGNRSAREQLGVRPNDESSLLEDVLEPPSQALYRDVVDPQVRRDGHWQGELTLRTRSGDSLSVSARVVAHGPASATTASGGPRSVSLFARDITELKAAEKKLRQLATHDYLTGLPNRLLLYDRLEHALHRFSRHGTAVALMFCDLDGFKPVNDRYGHHVGDGVLTEVADRIHSVVRDTDTAARLGGDEFGVLVEGVDDRSTLDVVAERLIAAIARPIRVNGTSVQIGVSIGIAVASERTSQADALVAAADSAMYRAKAAGRGRYVYWDPDADDSGSRTAAPGPAPDAG